MGDFPYLEWMTRLYMDKANRTRLDADYIKGQGIANACLSQDPTEARFQLLYQIENNWYNGKHPSSCEELKESVRDHKRHLSELRKGTTSELEKLKPNEEHLDPIKLFSERHSEQTLAFSDNVFSLCQNLTENMKRLLRNVVESSVKSAGDAPCAFAVIEFGPVSWGESSSYSSLDIGLLIENEKHRDYFKQLSVDLCFRMMCFGETSVKLLKIDELKHVKLGSIEEATGLSVSHLLPKAFHVCTVEGLLKKCRDESEILSTFSRSTLIYPAIGKGRSMYDQFMQQISDDIAKSGNMLQMKLYSSLSQHISNYRLVIALKLPPCTADKVAARAKRDKWQFLVVLLRKLQILLHTKTSYSWDTLACLLDLGVISKQDHNELKTALGLSLFATMNADLAVGKQVDWLLFTPDSLIPAVSRSLCITAGHILLSLHKSALSYVSSNPIWKRTLNSIFSFFSSSSRQPSTVIDTVKPIFHGLTVSIAADFMLRVELLLFVKDYVAAFNCLKNAVGEKTLEKIDLFVDVLCHNYGIEITNPLIIKYCKMCFAALFFSHKYTQSVEFMRWLILNDSYSAKESFFSISQFSITVCNVSSLRPWANFVRGCYNLKVHHRGAKTIINQLLNLIKVKFSLRKNQSLPELVEYLKSHRYTSQSMCSLVGDLCKSYGKHCQYLKEFDEALSFYKESCTLFKLLVIDYDHTVRYVLYNIGDTHRDMEDYTKAMEYFRKSLAMSEYLHSDGNHEEVAFACILIADTYTQMGKYTEALEYYARAVNIRRTVCGESSVSVAESYHRLSHLYADAGQYNKSLEYHFNSLDIHRSANGVTFDEPDAVEARYYSCIADVYATMGEYALSLEYYTLSLNITTAIHSEKAGHIAISARYNEIGALHGEMGDYKTSMEYYRKSLAMRKRLCGANVDHQYVAYGYTLISIVYSAMGEHAKSVEYLTMALEMKQRLYGDTVNHIDIAKCYSNFGDFYRSTGEYPKSLEWCMKSLNMKKHLYGDIDHPSIAESLKNIGYLYTLMGEYVKSSDYNFRYLAMVRGQHQTIMHPDIAESYRNIGHMFLLMRLYSTSLTYLTKSLEMYLELYGKDADHPAIATSYTQLGCIYSKTSKYTEAVENLTKALCIRKHLYGKDTNHALIAFTYCCLGETYTAMRDDVKDIQYHKESKHMLKKLYHGNHPDIAMVYRKMGQMYSTKSKPEDSLDCHNKSLAIRKALYGANTNHPDIADNYHDLGNMYLNMDTCSDNCYSKAYDYYTKSLNMRKVLFGESTDHPDIAESYNQISNVCSLMGKQAESLENLNKSVEMMKAVTARFVDNVSPK